MRMLKVFLLLAGISLLAPLSACSNSGADKKPADGAAASADTKAASPGPAELTKDVKQAPDRPLTDGLTYKVPLRSGAATTGEATALVTILEFSEFQCPFCAKVIPTLKKLKEEYGAQLRLQFRHNPLPFHKNAEQASVLAEAVRKVNGEKAFWAIHDQLFEKQREWSNLQDQPLTDKFKELAEAAGADWSKVLPLLNDVPQDIRQAIQEDKSVAATFGSRGTPGFFVNGQKFPGAQPYERFKQIMDQELEKAKKFSGAADVYEKVVADGRTKADTPERKGAPVDKTVYKVEIPKGAYVTGAKTPKVVMVVFSDFQCPFAGRAVDTYRKLLAAYPNDLALYFAHNPLSFHKNALSAAVAAMAAGKQGKFWEMHDQLFFAQKEWGQLAPAELSAKLVEYATKAGVKNTAAITQALSKPTEYAAIIKAQQSYGLTFGARGTPTTFVNGIKVAGARPFEDFKAIVDEELVKAGDLLKKGVKPGALYAETIKNGKEKADITAPAQPPEDNAVQNFTDKDIQGSPFRGPKNAPVTIMEFSEFQCPFCHKVNPAIKRIQTDYAGKVKIVWINTPLPFHKNAKAASVAFLAAADQGKAWEMHDKLFEKQGDWSRLGPEELNTAFEQYAKELGLDGAKFKTAINNPQGFDDLMNKDQALAGRVGARGTPTFFVNGKKLVGAQPFEEFQKLIEEALAPKK